MGKFGYKHTEEAKKRIKLNHRKMTKVDIDNLLKTGQKTRFKKGNIPHNKGKQHSIETKLKMSKKAKGRISPFKGKHHSEQARKKIREKNKGHISWNKGKKTGHIPWNKGLKGFRAGEKSHFWKGGISKHYKIRYYSFEYRQWRKLIFERDNYTCQVCRKVGGYLTAHHIKSFAKYPELRFDINNGITLCEDCHKLTDNYMGRGKKSSE